MPTFSKPRILSYIILQYIWIILHWQLNKHKVSLYLMVVSKMSRQRRLTIYRNCILLTSQQAQDILKHVFETSFVRFGCLKDVSTTSFDST